MRALICLAALAAASAAVSAPLKKAANFRRNIINQLAAERVSDLPADQWYTQIVDHFDVTSNATWQQRYWVNETFWTGNVNSPVFVYIEGEAAGSAADVVLGQHVELAQQFGALVVALEHRFYGESQPTGDLSTGSLKFLSSHQALADLARFIDEYLVPTYKLDLSQNKLVTFGGSYPGALSAWARLRLPHLVYAALSTSSPVQAVADFYGYNDVIADSLANTAVGGSPFCLARVKQAFMVLDAAMRNTTESKTEMSSLMYSCAPALSANDVMMLATNVAGAIMGVVQYNNDQPSYNIANICATMTASNSSAINALAQVVQATSGGQCIDNSYTDYIQSLQQTAVGNQGGVGDRQWTWQTCTQFGYYQSCDSGRHCPFSTLMTLQSNYQMCVDIFGNFVDAASNIDRIEFTNAYLGGYGVDRTADRIIFTNGGIDPWHALSVTPDRATNPDNLALLIPTGAHCSQMFPSMPNDPPDRVAARVAAAQQLKEWLQ